MVQMDFLAAIHVRMDWLDCVVIIETGSSFSHDH